MTLRMNPKLFFDQLIHFEEIWLMTQFKLDRLDVWKDLTEKDMRPTLKKCFYMCDDTAATWARITRSLDSSIRNILCVTWVILKAADCIEDDLTVPIPQRRKMLQEFTSKIWDPDWKYTHAKTHRERCLLDDFQAITYEFRLLHPAVQEALIDHIQGTIDGFLKYMEREISTLEEFDDYHWYTGGLHSKYLAQYQQLSGLEPGIADREGKEFEIIAVFNLETGTITDFAEDCKDKNHKIPREVWGKYVKNIEDLQKKEYKEQAIKCVNELACHVLGKMAAFDIEEYGQVKHQCNFYYMTIPMGFQLAKLAKLYNNDSVFHTFPNPRPGEVLKMAMMCNNMENIKAVVTYYVNVIYRRIPHDDPNAEQTREHCVNILKMCVSSKVFDPNDRLPIFFTIAVVLLAVLFIWFIGIFA